MITKLINNILKANDENRAICISSLIRIELEQVADFLSANDISFNDNKDIVDIFGKAFGDGWDVQIVDNGYTLQICEIPDNWVTVHIKNDGTVDDSYYV